MDSGDPCLLRWSLGLISVKNMVVNMSHPHCFPNLKWLHIHTVRLLGETYVYRYTSSFKPWFSAASGLLVRRGEKMQAALPEAIAQCPSALASLPGLSLNMWQFFLKLVWKGCRSSNLLFFSSQTAYFSSLLFLPSLLKYAEQPSVWIWPLFLHLPWM